MYPSSNIASFYNEKPVVLWVYGVMAVNFSKRVEKQKKIMTYDTIDKTAWALSILRKRHEFLEKRIIQIKKGT